MPKEFLHNMSKALKAGVVPLEDARMNVQALETCRNLRPTPYGLAPIRDIYYASAPNGVSWPFPQAIQGRVHNLVGYADALYSAGTALFGTTTLITTKNPAFASPASIPNRGITAGDVWHHADFGETVFLTNSANLVFTNPYLSREISGTTWFSGGDPIPRTVCGFRGTLFMAQFASGSHFDSTDWGWVWDVAVQHMPDFHAGHEDQTLGSGWIMYSQQGGGAHDAPFTLELAMLGYPQDGTFAKLKGEIAAALRNRTIGFLRNVYPGTIYCLKPIGARVMVYGDYGVSYIGPSDAANRWQVYEFLDVGVDQRRAVVGDDRDHWFIDKEDCLWHIDRNGSILRRGYEDVIGTITQPNMTFDPVRREVYISDGTTCLVVGEEAAYTIPENPTSLVRAASNMLVGFNGGGTGTTFEVVTVPFDFHNRDRKVLRLVEAGFYDLTNVQAQILFRYQGETTWRTSATVPLSQVNWAFFGITGHEFKVKLTGTVGSTDPKLEYLHVRWQQESKLAIRGLTAQGD